MFAKVSVFTRNGAGYLVQGLYVQDGKKLRYSDPVKEGQTAKEVREAQWQKAAQEFGNPDL